MFIIGWLVLWWKLSLGCKCISSEVAEWVHLLYRIWAYWTMSVVNFSPDVFWYKWAVCVTFGQCRWYIGLEYHKPSLSASLHYRAKKILFVRVIKLVLVFLVLRALLIAQHQTSQFIKEQCWRLRMKSVVFLFASVWQWKLLYDCGLPTYDPRKPMHLILCCCR